MEEGRKEEGEGRGRKGGRRREAAKFLNQEFNIPNPFPERHPAFLATLLFPPIFYTL
jgi:hypothetical protein